MRAERVGSSEIMEILESLLHMDYLELKAFSDGLTIAKRMVNNNQANELDAMLVAPINFRLEEILSSASNEMAAIKSAMYHERDSYWHDLGIEDSEGVV